MYCRFETYGKFNKNPLPYLRLSCKNTFVVSKIWGKLTFMSTETDGKFNKIRGQLHVRCKISPYLRLTFYGGKFGNCTI